MHRRVLGEIDCSCLSRPAPPKSQIFQNLHQANTFWSFRFFHPFRLQVVLAVLSAMERQNAQDLSVTNALGARLAALAPGLGLDEALTGWELLKRQAGNKRGDS